MARAQHRPRMRAPWQCGCRGAAMHHQGVVLPAPAGEGKVGAPSVCARACTERAPGI